MRAHRQSLKAKEMYRRLNSRLEIGESRRKPSHFTSHPISFVCVFVYFPELNQSFEQLQQEPNLPWLFSGGVNRIIFPPDKPQASTGWMMVVTFKILVEALLLKQPQQGGPRFQYLRSAPA